MPIYQTNNYKLLQIKEKASLMNLSSCGIKHELHAHSQMETSIHIYVYIYTHTHSHIHAHNSLAKNYQ